jgi:hypothetical protein
MPSSPAIPVTPAGVHNLGHCVMESPIDIFAKRSMQDDAPRHDTTNRPYNDRSWVMEPIDPNQQSSEDHFHRAPVCATESLLNGLPPVSQHLSFYAKRAGQKFKPYQPGGHVPTALEHCFVTKNILKRNEADISLIDVHQVLPLSTPQVTSY